jgi:hypothetical protein
LNPAVEALATLLEIVSSRRSVEDKIAVADSMSPGIPTPRHESPHRFSGPLPNRLAIEDFQLIFSSAISALSVSEQLLTSFHRIAK